MGARNRGGIGLSYRPARLHAGGIHSLESIPGLHKGQGQGDTPCTFILLAGAVVERDTPCTSTLLVLVLPSDIMRGIALLLLPILLLQEKKQ
jgi:hypothetical protein